MASEEVTQLVRYTLEEFYDALDNTAKRHIWSPNIQRICEKDDLDAVKIAMTIMLYRSKLALIAITTIDELSEARDQDTRDLEIKLKLAQTVDDVKIIHEKHKSERKCDVVKAKRDKVKDDMWDEFNSVMKKLIPEEDNY